jgi:hypothetical protein
VADRAYDSDRLRGWYVGEGFGPAFRDGEIVASGDARRSCPGIGSGGWCSTLVALGKDPWLVVC